MRIVVHLIGNTAQGTGHVYRMLRLTSACSSHDIIRKSYKESDVYFLLNVKEKLAIKILDKNNISYTTYDANIGYYTFLSEMKPDIIINDCLNTCFEFIRKQKLYAKKVINFEDYGEGANLADVVINSFYNENVLNGDKVKSGLKYTLLSPVLCHSVASELNAIPKKLILSFGGSDPSNISESIIETLVANGIHKKIHVLIVLGIGYQHKLSIVNYVEDKENISISIDEQNMIHQIQNSDIAITSCGCAMFECCFFQVPTICIAHHERELLHTNLCPKNALINMGIFCNLDNKLLIDELNILIDSKLERVKMREHQKSIREDIKDSYKNVFDLIFKE